MKTEYAVEADHWQCFAYLINMGEASGKDLENYVTFLLSDPCYMQAMWAKTDAINVAIEGKAWVN